MLSRRKQTFTFQYIIEARPSDVLAWLHSPPLFCWAKTKTTPILCNPSDPIGGPYDWTMEAMHCPMTWRAFFQFPANGLTFDMHHKMMGVRLHSEWRVESISGEDSLERSSIEEKVTLDAHGMLWPIVKPLAIDWVSKRNNVRLVGKIEEDARRDVGQGMGEDGSVGK